MSRESREQTRRLSWLTEAQAAIGWGIILFLAALLGAIYVRQASRIAAVGRRVQVKQIELVELKRTNADTEQSIAEAQSIERLQDAAFRLGFVQADPEDIEYVVVPDYPIESDVVVETAVVEPTPTHPIPTTITEAIWQSIQNGISNLVQGEARE
jgi:hypothetical protein